jgi:hypothetical protein
MVGVNRTSVDGNGLEYEEVLVSFSPMGKIGIWKLESQKYLI